MENIKKLIAEYSSEISPKAIEFRRHFHKYPELSEMEFETSKFISNILTKWGIEHKAGIAGTGIKALIKGEKGEGKTIALRADMDALPITENSGVDFSSVNGGVMHACGHDIHMANLLGTVYVLNKLKSEFSGNLVIIFQPSEEKFPGGAIRMINEGVLEKLMRSRFIKQYEEDHDLLEDVIIEYKQALEMANIYATIINSTMDAYASIISNNLNLVMKFMAAMTIVLAVPTVISGFFGQNIQFPFYGATFAADPWPFILILVLTLGSMGLVAWWLNRRGMF